MGDLAKSVYENKIHFNTPEQLKFVIEKKWSKTGPEIRQKLVSSLKTKIF